MYIKQAYIFAIIIFLLSNSVLIAQTDSLSKHDRDKVIQYKDQFQKYYAKNNKNQAAYYLTKLGMLYWENEIYSEAINYFTQSLKYYDELRNKNGLQVVNSYLGAIYSDQRMYKKALEHYNTSLTIAKQINEEQSIAGQLLNVATTLAAQKKYNEANKLLLEATEIAHNQNNIRLLRRCYSSLAENYQKLGDNELSIEYYNFFLSFDRIIKEEEMKDMQIKSQIEVAKAQAEKKAKELELSLEQYKLEATQDSLDEVYKKNEEKEMQINLLEKEKEIQELALKEEELRNKQNRQMIHAFITIFMIVILFSFFLVRQYLQKRKANKALEQKNEEVQAQNEQIQAQSAYLEEVNKDLEKLSIVASKTNNAVAITGAFGQIEWINDAYKKLWSYKDMNEIEEKSGGLIITQNSPNEAVQSFKKCVEEKKSATYVARSQNSKAKEVWTQTTLSPILDEYGDIMKIVSIDADITDVKLAEQKLKDSIVYASRIQKAIFPPKGILKSLLHDYFLIFRPRDIVSGDFYWMQKVNDHIIIAAADCTGHGVPGALMSIMGISFLNEVVMRKDVQKTSDALNLFRDYIKNSLRQNGEGDDSRNEGMDIALCAYNTQTGVLQYAGAYNPLYIIRDEELIEYKADKMPIGSYRKERPFTNHEIKVEKGDRFYIFSDGITDQFGGPKGERFKPYRLKKLLVDTSKMSFKDQKHQIEMTMDQWQSLNRQIDDIILLGFQLI